MRNPRTFVTETFKVGIIKFQGFCVSVTSIFHHFAEVHVMRQEVSKLNSLKSKNPRTFVTETFKVGIMKFQGFRVLVTSDFHHFPEAHKWDKRFQN